MNQMFSDCQSLELLPDISKWNTSNVTNMSGMFANCIFLSYLPDLSKWSINKVIDINEIFSCCSSLKSLPDYLNGRPMKLIIYMQCLMVIPH